jgi:hypothetical protein
MSKDTSLDGPDFLDQYADRLEANSLTIEADQIRTIRRQWLQERVDQQALADQATYMDHQLNNARKALGQPATKEGQPCH